MRWMRRRPLAWAAAASCSDASLEGQLRWPSVAVRLRRSSEAIRQQHHHQIMSRSEEPATAPPLVTVPLSIAAANICNVCFAGQPDISLAPVALDKLVDRL